MEATLSILGMYRYNPTIFSDFRTPDNVEDDVVIGEILLQCAEFEILYPEPETLKTAIKLWTDKEFPIWDELQKTKEYEYNPIFNKEGMEKEELIRDLTETRNLQRSTNQTETRNLSAGGTNKNQVKGFNNSAGWNDSEMDTVNSTDTGTVGVAGLDGDTGTVKNGGYETITRTYGGNIGVTMTQELIEAQRKVVQFDVVQYIVDSFKRRFCLLIY